MECDYDEEIVGEGPCEFCGELYPLMLLIEHQTIHLSEDFLDVDINIAQNEAIFKEPVKTEVIDVEMPSPISKIEPKIAVKCKQTESCSSKTESQIAVEKKQIQSSDVIKKKREVEHESEKMKEFTSESGEKLLVYGCEMDHDQDLENEEQTYKMPNNPLLHGFCEKKDVEDINNLSDDDNSESLEEFWKRARDVLKRNRVKSDCS